MHDDVVGKDEDGHMPTNRVRALETPEKEMSDPIYETQVTPDVTMEEEKAQDEDMTLGGNDIQSEPVGSHRESMDKRD